VKVEQEVTKGSQGSHSGSSQGSVSVKVETAVSIASSGPQAKEEEAEEGPMASPVEAKEPDEPPTKRLKPTAVKAASVGKAPVVAKAKLLATPYEHRQAGVKDGRAAVRAAVAVAKAVTATAVKVEKEATAKAKAPASSATGSAGAAASDPCADQK